MAAPAHVNPFVRLARAVEELSLLDPAVQALDPAARALVASPPRRALLQGEWLGHAVHPLMTFLPLGTWTSALVLDALGGVQSRPAAQRLVGVGLLAAVPTAITGWAEWADAGGRDRRTGVVHAAANTVAITFFVRSWRARRQGDHRRGARLALAGGAAASAGGFFGSHLAQARDVSSRHPEFSDS